MIKFCWAAGCRASESDALGVQEEKDNQNRKVSLLEEKGNSSQRVMFQELTAIHSNLVEMLE